MGSNSVNRSQKKLLMLGIYCAAIILGVYMTFFNKTPEEDNVNEKVEDEMMIQGVDYSDKKLPDVENETSGERYGNGAFNDMLYFSNTTELDEGNMPLEAQAILVEETQHFLNLNGYGDVTELYIYEESYEESAEKISFICFMDGHEEALQIEYWFNESYLKYYILPDGADAGEENE